MAKVTPPAPSWNISENVAPKLGRSSFSFFLCLSVLLSLRQFVNFATYKSRGSRSGRNGACEWCVLSFMLDNILMPRSHDFCSSSCYFFLLHFILLFRVYAHETMLHHTHTFHSLFRVPTLPPLLPLLFAPAVRCLWRLLSSLLFLFFLLMIFFINEILWHNIFSVFFFFCLSTS